MRLLEIAQGSRHNPRNKMTKLDLLDIISHYTELLKRNDLNIHQNIERFIKTFGANDENKQHLISQCRHWQ